MTYLTPAQWWLRPFAFAARCQRKTIGEQFREEVDVFDLRIAFDKNGNPFFAHGIVSYKEDVYSTLAFLQNCATLFGPWHADHIYVRVINERNKDFLRFAQFCDEIVATYPDLVFFGGRNKKDWQILYDFREIEIENKIVDRYSSNNHGYCKFDGLTETEHKNFTGTIIDDLYPELYAKKYNEKMRALYENEADAILYQDFIGVY
jgi:hypothetical protein